MGLVQAGFLGALGALAIPILIHLIFGRRARRVDLGTLRFLKIVLRDNSRRRRIKRWLLLALRMACVALLAVLFARPFLAADDGGAGQRLVIVLVDRSASMNLKSDGQRLLDLAAREASEVAAGCGKGDELRLAFFDHKVQPAVGKNRRGTGNTNKLQSAEQISSASDFLSAFPPEQTYGSTDYGAALAWARDLCIRATQRRKELYLITDLQRSGLEGTPVDLLAEDVRVRIVDLGKPYPRNMAVTSAVASKTWVRPGEQLAVTATALNGGPTALKGATCLLQLSNGEHDQRFQQRVDLDPGATVTVQFDIPSLSQGLWQGHVALELNDDLTLDNRRHLAVLAAPPIDVLLVDGDPGPPAFTAETYFLEAALRLAAPGEVYLDSPFQPRTIAWDAAGLAEEIDASHSAIVLANVPHIAPPTGRRLGQFVEAGGGLLVFGGDQVTANAYRALGEFGLLPGRIRGAAPSSSLPWRLESWDREHPVWKLFGDPQHGDLARLAFRARTHIEPAEGTEVLARFRGGAAALLQREHGRGKALWLALAADRDWGDWPRSRLYLPLVHQMLLYLAGMSDPGPVENLLLDDPRHLAQRPIPGIKLDGRRARVVNLNPRESETDRLTPDELAAHFRLNLSDPGEPAAKTSGLVKTAAAEMRPGEVWHWALVPLIALLLVEGLIANRTAA